MYRKIATVVIMAELIQTTALERWNDHDKKTELMQRMMSISKEGRVNYLTCDPRSN